MENKIIWVKGNTQPLLIPLEQEIVPVEGEVYTEPYYPYGEADVKVILQGKYKSYKFAPIVDGNLLRFTDNGTLPAGCYDVEITIDNPDGTRQRSMWGKQIVVTDANDSVLKEWDDFKEQAPEARAAIFFFAKGDKGEPLTYQDLTPEQIAELQRPATEKVAEVTELEQQWTEAETGRVEAERGRVSAEQGRVDAESLRVSNEEARQLAEGQRQQAYTEAEIQRNSDYQNAEDSRNSQYSAAEGLRNNLFASAEQTRDESVAEAVRLAGSATTAANNAAMLANNKAQYAQEKGDYAKDKGDYADGKGDYADEKALLAQQKASVAEEKAGLAEEKAIAANNAANTANTAAQNARADYVGEDNYVRHWNPTSQFYEKTNLYVKGDPGTTDYNDLQNKPDLSLKLDVITEEELNEIFN